MARSDQSKRAREIFDGALDISSAEEQAAYLKEACGADAALFQRVQALVQANEVADSFLPDQPERGDVLEALEKAGDWIGRYKLLQKIGEGGCGVVYMAEQEEPVRRRVALKVIKLGMDTRSVIARFEAERQALAMMDHPNIAKVFDAGSTERPLSPTGGEVARLVRRSLRGGGRAGEGEVPLSAGRPYFVMELVRGVKITDYCDEKNLSTRERLGLFSLVCHAIQHAHQKGIIHRDIKPSNVLVTVNDGVAVPKVIDFGIAKATKDQRLTDKTVFTAFEQFIGTPAYMSPEQAEITSLDVDTRSDIYSLGVLLYELLTGKTPFDPKDLLQAGLDEMRRTIREKEPECPSTRVSTLGGEERTTTAKRRGLDAPKLVNALRGDLDWIVMKCLEKDRARRYETANGLASDIQRHLHNEPVVACPASNLYRFQKLVRRNKLAFAAAGAVVAALVVGLAIALWQSIEKTRAYHRALAAEKKAQANETKAQAESVKSQQVAQFLKEMLAGAGPEVAKGRDATILLEILHQTSERIGKELTNQPAVEADLLLTIGRVYNDLGRYQQAEAILRRGVDISRAFQPDSDDSPILSELGSTLSYQGKLAEAEDLFRKTLAMSRKYRGDDDNTAVMVHNLAEVLLKEGKLSEAKFLAIESLTLRKKLLGDHAPQLVGPLGILSAVEQALGNLVEAETHLREALVILEKAPGGHDSVLQRTRLDLATILGAQNKWSEAETLEREGLALQRKLLGADHPEIATDLNNLAFSLVNQDKLDEAEKLYREALEIQRKRLGHQHPGIGTTLKNLADIHRRRGNLAEAVLLLREAVDLLRKQSGGDPERATLALGRTLPFLAADLVALGQFAEARSLAEEAVTLCQRHPDWHVEIQWSARTVLGEALADQGNLAEAEAIQSELVAMLQRRAPDISNNGAALAELAVTLIAEKKFTDAESVARHCLEFRQKQYPDAWHSFSARVLLGESLLGQKKYGEAEPLLLAGYEGMMQRRDKLPSRPTDGYRRQPRLKRAIELLVQLYEVTARPVRVAEWKHKLAEFEKAEIPPKADAP